MVVYLDDLVVYGKSLEDHLSYLNKVLFTLRKHQLYIKMEKCEFAQKSIKFLGHLISKGEVWMDRKNVQAVLDWLAQTKVLELCTFLKLVNF